MQQVKGVAHELSDPHRAILLRKAVHHFNTRRAHLAKTKGEVVAAAESAAAGRPLITVRGGGHTVGDDSALWATAHMGDGQPAPAAHLHKQLPARLAVLPSAALMP